MLQRGHRQAGFTLIEILVVTMIAAILFALTAVNLRAPQASSSISAVTQKLVADLKSQQILAMSGYNGSSTSAQVQGVYLQPASFTLFAGGTYNAGDTNNYTETLDGGTTLTTTFASGIVQFAKGSGEVAFTTGDNTITLANGTSSATITINRFGTVTAQ